MKAENSLVKIEHIPDVGVQILFKSGHPAKIMGGLSDLELHALKSALDDALPVLEIPPGEQADRAEVRKALREGRTVRILGIKMPHTVAVSPSEGAPWILWSKLRRGDFRAVHAIMFDNGRIWDVVNGWRPERVEVPTGGPVTIDHPTTFAGYEVTLTKDELNVLIDWNAEKKHRAAARQDYLLAHDLRSRQAELAMLKGDGK